MNRRSNSRVAIRRNQISKRGRKKVNTNNFTKCVKKQKDVSIIGNFIALPSELELWLRQVIICTRFLNNKQWKLKAFENSCNYWRQLRWVKYTTTDTVKPTLMSVSWSESIWCVTSHARVNNSYSLQDIVQQKQYSLVITMNVKIKIPVNHTNNYRLLASSISAI